MGQVKASCIGGAAIAHTLVPNPAAQLWGHTAHHPPAIQTNEGGVVHHGELGTDALDAGKTRCMLHAAHVRP